MWLLNLKVELRFSLDAVVRHITFNIIGDISETALYFITDTVLNKCIGVIGVHQARHRVENEHKSGLICCYYALF